MNKLKFALIGTGGIAQTYAQAFQQSNCCQLVAVADINQDSAKALKVYDVASAPRYVVKPAYKCQVFRAQNTLGDSHFPFNLARPEAVDYNDENFQGTIKGLHDVLVLPINEKYEAKHAEFLADSIREAVESVKIIGASADNSSCVVCGGNRCFEN